MKKWMALLLCCLLCLCAAGAMAEEAVTLSLWGGNQFNIYPHGYTINDGELIKHQGKYIITGESYGVDTCLDFYSIPKGETLATVPVTYTVIFQNVTIEPYVWGTAVRFGHEETNNGQDITLNLINIGNNSITELPINHMVFENAGGEIVNEIRNPAHDVIIQIHNAPGSKLTLKSGLGLAGVEKPTDYYGDANVYGKNTYVYEGDNKIDPNKTEYEITSCHCAGKLTTVPQKPATCTEDGYQAHWKCNVCESLFSDKDGNIATTEEAVRIPAVLHQPTLVPAKDPTCTEKGNIEHYRCTREGCGKLFSDANGTNELTVDDVSLPAQHDLEKVPAKDPTCTEKGNIEHYRCTRCGSLLNDANGSKELTVDDVSLPAQHDLEKVPAKDPTYEQEGNIEYHRCKRCGKLFSDANGTQELTANDVVRAKLVRTDTLPQTGDSSSLLRWTALLGACCAGLWCLNRRRG